MMTIRRIPAKGIILATFGSVTHERMDILDQVTAAVRYGYRAHYSPVTRKWTVVFRLPWRKALSLPGSNPFRDW